MTIDLSILDDEILGTIVEELIPETEAFPYPISLHEALICERERRKAGSSEPPYTVDVRRMEGEELYRSAHRTLLLAVCYVEIGKRDIASFFMRIHNELLAQVIETDGVCVQPCDSEMLVH